jgi:hypothetical protein
MRFTNALLIVAALLTQCGAATPLSPEILKKWDEKWKEWDKRGFTYGTIDEFVTDHQMGPGIMLRTPGVLLVELYSRTNVVYVLYQTRSIQGRDILLGPIRMPDMMRGRAEYLQFWKIYEPPSVFDETKHYSGLYRDNVNRAAMAVVYEKRTWTAQPVHPLYHPRRVENPHMELGLKNTLARFTEILERVIKMFGGK